jgi:formamidopyrimidine-DNA glycosylase
MIKEIDHSNTWSENRVTPRCPHCTEDIDALCVMEMQSTFGKRYVYYCPHCRAVLGVSHRKGFWMG